MNSSSSSFTMSPDLSLALGNRPYNGSAGFRIYSSTGFPCTNASTAAESSPTIPCTTAHLHKITSCQVPDCDADLSQQFHKDYHRRHKVCDFHSKASAVQLRDIQQQYRFCQQCSKFHPISEFDGDKRSCRCRLATHNQRRQHRRRAIHRTTTSTAPLQNNNQRYHPYQSHAHPPANADNTVSDADADRGCALSFLLPSHAPVAPTSSRSFAHHHDLLRCALSPLLTPSSDSSSTPCDAASPSINSPAISTKDSTSKLPPAFVPENSSSQTSPGAMGLRPFHFVLLQRLI